jgi:hypothetical protein
MLNYGIIVKLCLSKLLLCDSSKFPKQDLVVTSWNAYEPSFFISEILNICSVFFWLIAVSFKDFFSFRLMHLFYVQMPLRIWGVSLIHPPLIKIKNNQYTLRSWFLFPCASKRLQRSLENWLALGLDREYRRWVWNIIIVPQRKKVVICEWDRANWKSSRWSKLEQF